MFAMLYNAYLTAYFNNYDIQYNSTLHYSTTVQTNTIQDEINNTEIRQNT